MRKYKEFTIQSADGTVIWTTSLLVTETELKPERSAGEYWRGTYEVKRGDTLSDVAKRYGTRVSTLLELNPSIKDKDEISVGAILRVPPNKQSNDRNSERKNPPKPKQPVDETHGSTPSASSSVKSSQSDQIASNSSASSVQSRAAAPSASQGVSPHTNAQPRQVQQQKTTPNADSQTINKIESSNQDGNSVTTLTPECVCKKYDLIWGAKVSCAFRKKVVEISKRINCDPNDLMAVMAVETGRSFLPYQLSNKKGHSQPKSASEVTEQMVSGRAVGLIQFTKDAVHELNTQLAKQKKSSVTKLKLAKMSAVEQLDYVELHIKTAADRLMKGQRLSLSDLYTSVFAPAHMGKSEDAVLYHSGTKAYSANRSVDIGDGRGGKPDGKITKAELAKRTFDIKQEGMSHHSNYSDHEGERVPTTATQAQTLKSEGASEKSECKDGCSVAVSSLRGTSIKTPPWMEIAIREAKQWKGKKENQIEKLDNYHKLVRSGLNTLVGDENPWCASFINYCLKESGYQMSQAVASSQSFKWDSNFVKISKPAYGALAVWTNPKKKTKGHVCFVLGVSGNNFIRLGGNQDNMITVDSRPISTYQYYFPKVYSKGVDGEITDAPTITLRELDAQGLPVHDSKKTL